MFSFMDMYINHDCFWFNLHVSSDKPGIDHFERALKKKTALI